MFPVRSDVLNRRLPVALYFLLALNFAVFFRELQLGSGLIEDFVDTFGLVPARDFVVQPRHWLPFLTSMFLHGGLFHLISNLWALWLFGGAVESHLGSIKFLIFYLLSGFGAALVHVILNPDSTMPVVGASGAIAGVMAGYLWLFPRSRIRMFTLLVFYPIFFDLPAVVFFVLWFLGQLLSAASVVQQGVREVGGIAFSAHIGGFVTGILLIPVLSGRRGDRRRS